MELSNDQPTKRYRSSFVWGVLPPLAAILCPALAVLSGAPLPTLAGSLGLSVLFGWTGWEASRQTVTVTDQRIEVANSSRYLDEVSSPVSFPLESVKVYRRLVIRWLFTDVVRWTLSQEGVRGDVKINVYWLRRSQRRQLSDLLLAVAAEDNGRPAEGRTLVKTNCGPAPKPKNAWEK